MKTIIKINCQDQELKITDEPLIASGGVHENYIEFTFCEKWAGMAKTAVFYCDPKNLVPYYSVVDEAGMCEVPYEITKDECKMYFGVFGTLGDVTRTSEIVAYKVNKGAITTELVPSNPTPDIWEQLLGAYGDVLAAVEESNAAQKEFIQNAENKNATFKEEVLQQQEDFKAETNENQELFKNEVRELIEEIPDLADVKTAAGTVLKSRASVLNLKSIIGSSVQRTTSGKNLLNCDGLSTTTSNGITFTPVYRANGELEYINVNGTATADVSYDLTNDNIVNNRLVLKVGTYYTLSGCASGGSSATYCIRVTHTNGLSTFGTSYDFGNSARIIQEMVSLNDSIYSSVDIVVKSGTTVSNLKFYPLVATETDTTYEPFTNGASPNSDYPQAIRHAFDCVEMIQGFYMNGVFTLADNSICSKNKIPCKSGDIVRIETEGTNIIVISRYNASGFVNYVSGQSVTSYETTIPSDITSFTFHVINSNGITTDTVGKITLTINGKYLGSVKGHGKNFIDYRGMTARTSNGVIYTPNSDGSITASGTATSTSSYGSSCYLKAGNYILSGCQGGSNTTFDLRMSINAVTYRDIGNGVTVEVTEDGFYVWQAYVRSGTAMNHTFYPMIRKADITDDTYEPYTETTAYFLMNEPLKQDDLLGSTEIKRKRASVVFDGSDDEAWGIEANSSGNVNFYVLMSNAIGRQLVLCSHFQSVDFVGDIQNAFISTGKYLNIVPLLGFTTVAEWKTWLQSNPITVEYELATPTIETLDTESQIALNSLETFDGVTYIEVDSVVQPSEVVSQYACSEAGAIVLKNEKELTSKDGKLYVTLDYGTNLDEVTEPGKYYCVSALNGRSKNGVYGFLDVMVQDNGELVKQILHESQHSYERHRYKGQWSDWIHYNSRIKEFRFIVGETTGDYKVNLIDNNYYHGGTYLVTIWRPAQVFRQVSYLFVNSYNSIYQYDAVVTGDESRYVFEYDADYECITIELNDYGDGGDQEVFVTVVSLASGMCPSSKGLYT